MGRDKLKLERNSFVSIDKNILDKPIWFIDNDNFREIKREFKIKNKVIENTFLVYEEITENGKYIFEISTEPPTAKDMLFLMFILYKSQCKNSNEVEFSLYEMVEFFKLPKKGDTYNRIKEALSKWSKVHINFDSSFYSDKGYISKEFGVIDNITYEKNRTYVRLNVEFYNSLLINNFFKKIPLLEYASMRRATAKRLYEILTKSFGNQESYPINIFKLRDKLTLSRNYKYKSEILKVIKPAVKEINERTHLNIDFTVKDEVVIFYHIKSKNQLEWESVLNKIEDFLDNQKDSYDLDFLRSFSIKRLSETDKSKGFILLVSSEEDKNRIENDQKLFKLLRAFGLRKIVVS